MTRREFLIGGSALVAALHAPSLAFTQQRRRPGKHLIRGFHLQTSVELDRMEEFYCVKLGLEKLSRDKRLFSFRGGATTITFERVAKSGEGPLTHFAFNVPENKVRGALDWTAERTDVIPAWGDLADPTHPKEIVHFRHWNAHSVFFWDPAFNLLELIARHDLDNGARGAFSTNDILYASEIGLAVKSPVEFAKWLNSELSIPAYPSGTSPQFAMGSEDGLLLCLADGQQWGGHTKTPVHWRSYKTTVEIQGSRPRTVDAPGHPFTLKVVP